MRARIETNKKYGKILIILIDSTEEHEETRWLDSKYPDIWIRFSELDKKKEP